MKVLNLMLNLDWGYKYLLRNIKTKNRIQFNMKGTNSWNVEEIENQPVVLFATGLGGETYVYTHGCIRWAKVRRGSTYYTGWVLCYASGKPITYTDATQPGSIRVSASGTYMTA